MDIDQIKGLNIEPLQFNERETVEAGLKPPEPVSVEDVNDLILYLYREARRRLLALHTVYKHADSGVLDGESPDIWRAISCCSVWYNCDR